ncbi:hypothetical protein ACQP0C_41760 (plasmid) [Nocardia sp. CA-129566]|uniref:hypothetical protein n=1 Tax=Nocardia sp. CA-129566 TaxID=3239976 RepID=UPI003D953AB7
MQDTTADLTPAITERANQLVDAVLALALGNTPGPAMFTAMRDHAEDASTAAPALHELLEIQTQGGHGALEDGYTPADSAAVAHALRTHILTRIAEKTGLTLTAAA